jgi:RNA polymerase II subunit A-like phosphatase
VNQAFKRGIAKVVRPQWLVDSCAHWRRMSEDDYLLEDDSGLHDQSDSGYDVTTGEDELASTSTPGPGGPNGHDDETNAEEAEPAWRPDEADWTAMDAEVEAALMESDDDTGASDVSESGANRTPRRRRRLESGDEASEGETSEPPGSPLLKRQRLARSRIGKSRLKVSFGNEDDDAANEHGDTGRASSDTESDVDWDAYADSLEGEFS